MHLLMTEFEESLTVLRWPCAVDRTVKSSYLLTCFMGGNCKSR